MSLGSGKNTAQSRSQDEMVGWHHRLNGHEFEQALGDGEGQGSQASCSSWGHKVRHDGASEQQQRKGLSSL